MEIKQISDEIKTEFQDASEISEEEFTEIITKLYHILQGMPKNAMLKHIKDLKISEYKKLFNL